MASHHDADELRIRALSQVRVDERAGPPKGSTSNWFRTRADWVLPAAASREHARHHAAVVRDLEGLPVVHSAQDLAAVVAEVVLADPAHVASVAILDNSEPSPALGKSRDPALP